MGIKTVVTLLLVISTASVFSVGEISDTEIEADSKVQRCVEAKADEIKKEALALLTTGDSKIDPTLFDNETVTAISYKKQLVSGTNYFIKTKIGKYIFHVGTHRVVNGDSYILKKVIGPMAENASIAYFE